MQPAKINYKIYQGSTFQETFRWESQTKVYVPIQSIAKSAPCVITTTQNHTLPVGWRFKVVGAAGMKELNSSADEYYTATETTDNTVTINSVNSLLYNSYTNGGVIEYNQPVAITNYHARMQFRKNTASAEILYEASSNIITIDQTASTISINIPATITQNFDFTSAVYSLELYKDDGYVTQFLVGNVTVVPEITR